MSTLSSTDSYDKTNPLAQPKGYYPLWTICLTGNLAFYVFFSIFAVFFVDFLGMNQSQASAVFGSFFALNWGLTPIGGYVSDHILGAKRSLVLGNILTTFGFAAQAVALFANIKWLVFLGFALTLIGSGTSRVNGIKMLSYMFEKHKDKADGAYTIYYAAVNVGSLLAFVIAPLIRHNDGTNIVYGKIFLLATAMMIICLAVLFFAGLPRWKELLKGHSQPMSPAKIWGCIVGYPISTALLYYFLNHLQVSNVIFIVVAVATVAVYLFELMREHGVSRTRMGAALLLTIEAVFFYILYAQMGTSMNFYGINNARPMVIFGYSVDNVILQAYNPLWIVVLSPFLAWFYNRQSAQGKGLSMPYKFVIGMCFSLLAFLTLGFSAHFADNAGLVSSSWFALANLFQSTAELLIGALGLSMVAKYVPTRINGLVVGLWYLSISVANILGGWIASKTGIKSGKMPAPESLAQYGKFFYILAAAIVVFIVIMAVAAPFLHRLAREREAEAGTA